MRIVLDASVAIAAQRPAEPAHAASRARLGRMVDRLTAPPHEVVTVGPRAARGARAIAIRGKLRGPDALYVWLARREGAPVCTIDQEIVARGARFCQIMAP